MSDQMDVDATSPSPQPQPSKHPKKRFEVKKWTALDMQILCCIISYGSICCGMPMIVVEFGFEFFCELRVCAAISGFVGIV
ncbi:hypothetical protein FOA43_001196 [Brettanomyces nanus]|uniref:Uncharacterized protein n=1 Tax=Eeniella nana TaxID=13502 RepID=A0A875RWY2_EENNA|nr:uncharacterized protein FOA43_001196 [Brettanomyces nanus]QPG73881.1 hypothetical protein FOA43_001196 [Brettanomyces nanus]